MVVRICLTARVRVEADGTAVPVGLGRLASLALAYLAVERHRPVTHDELAEALWGEDLPQSWRTSLRGIISRVRSVLAAAGLSPSEVLASSHGCYQLHLPDSAVVDVEVADSVLAEAVEELRAGRVDLARTAAAEAVEVAAGQFVPGAGTLWAEQRQAELRAVRVHALEVLAEACSSTGSHEAAVRAAEEAVALEPLRESAHRRLLLAHAAAGNRGEALRAYQRCRDLLVHELGVNPSATTEAAYMSLLQDDVVPPVGTRRPGLDGARARVPLTSFVGRSERVGEVRRLLGSSRLVTLTGPGGVGKSRLAVELADSFPGGAYLVELAPLSEPDLLTRHVLSAVGLREEPGRDDMDTLTAHLAGVDSLLILDNCEHLVTGCAELADVLVRSVPDLRVLATSREPLGVPGETRWVVPPLSTPDSGAVGVEAVAASEAARLFVDRARSVRPGFAVTDADADALAQVCRRLDGLPLALELAAGRLSVLSLREIAVLLDDRFTLLASGPRRAPARHRSLRAVLDWSYEALPKQERRLFACLSVFWTGFSLDSAEWLAGDDEAETGSVLDLLADLVNRSLLTAEDHGGVTRYRALETIRQYGRERLAEVAEQMESALTRHLEWATRLAEEAGAHLAGPDQALWLRRLDETYDDLQAALRWGLSGPGRALAVRLAAALGRFWELRGHLTEGRQWLEAALDTPDLDTPDLDTPDLGGPVQAPPMVRARALIGAAILAQGQGEYASARALYQEALVICRAADDRRAMAMVLHGLGNVAALQGDLAEARALYEQTLVAARQLGDEGAVAASLTNIGAMANNQGDLEAARSCFEQSLAIVRKLGDRDQAALVVGNLGYLAFQEGHYAEARSLFEESLSARRELGDAQGVVSALCNLGYLALAEGDHGSSRRLLEESLALSRDVGDRYWTMLSLLRLARVARTQGEYETAAALDREAMTLASGLGAKRAIAEWLEGMASTAASSGAFDRATSLMGAADAVRQAIGAPLPPRDVPGHEDQLALAREKIGDESFEAAWTAGRGMQLEAAMRYALSQEYD
jgi:predicted ATPase/DNA-binding SARP family transcriptional activator